MSKKVNNAMFSYSDLMRDIEKVPAYLVRGQLYRARAEALVAEADGRIKDGLMDIFDDASIELSPDHAADAVIENAHIVQRLIEAHASFYAALERDKETLEQGDATQLELLDNSLAAKREV